MNKPRPMNEEEQAELVAFLDGELHGEEARSVEARLSRDPALRAEADSLKRAWDLLDFLPQPEPSPSFTEKTLSRIEPAGFPRRSEALPHRRDKPAGSAPWARVALGVGWAAALLLAGWLGYRAYGWVSPHEPGDAELVRDLRVIENKRLYDLVDDLRFLEQLDHPDLFGDDTGS
jgi:anti-sigma factor RsiW